MLEMLRLEEQVEGVGVGCIVQEERSIGIEDGETSAKIKIREGFYS